MPPKSKTREQFDQAGRAVWKFAQTLPGHARTVGRRLQPAWAKSRVLAGRGWARWSQVPFKIRRNVYIGGAGAVAVLMAVMMFSHSGTSTRDSSQPTANARIILVDLQSDGAKGVKASAVGDLSSLPAPGSGVKLLAVGRFEPSGSSFPAGLRVTWPLPARRPAGEKLWIVTLDEANNRWLWTGENAEVASSGMQASGRVYHFSSVGLSDQKPVGGEEEGGGGKGGPRKWGALAQLASYIEVQHGGSAERSMVEYNKWLSEGGKTLVGSLKQKIQENRAMQEEYRKALEAWESIPEMSRPEKNFSEPKTVFETLAPAEQESIRKLMENMYGQAGAGKEAFHTVALVIDKGLEAPSEEFKAKKYSADPVNNELSLVMAEARDHWIDDVIMDVAQRNKWKVRRSDSGNQTSGMKSDLDQTFYVFEPDGKGGWKRAFDSDKEFIKQFKIEWEVRNKARNGGKLGLESLDIASIEGKNRFPDPRNVTLTSYSQEFRRTVIALRNTPGAYTTYGAVLQQMQLRALEAIRLQNPRAFRGYGPPDAPGGKVQKLEGYTQEEALDVMFGREMTPEIMKGLAFGAAVANFVELGHYMHDPKFEVKYHLRTFEDAVETMRLLQEGKSAADKREYEKIRDEDAPRVEQYLNELFPGAAPADANTRILEKLAMETSLKLRLMHKGKAVGGVAANATDEQKKMAVFAELAKAVYKDKYDPKNMEQIAHAEQEHRKLARELCLAAIYHTSDEAFGLAFNPANGKIDLSHMRHLLDVKSDADWAKVEQNIAEGMHVTLLYAMYDLGFAESRRLRDYLIARHTDQAWEIDKLWFRSQLQGIESVAREPGIYLETAGGKVEELSKRVQEHVLDELGLEFVESQAIAGHILLTENLAWNWRKLGHEKMNDPQTLLSLTNVLRTAIHSHGDMDPVMATVADEMFLNWVPVLGQLEQIRRADMKDLVIMGGSMAFPVAGQVYFAYQLGDAVYSIYDEGFAMPREENLVDAAYRGFVGPETRSFGEPGKPSPTWGSSDDTALLDARSNLALAEKRASIVMEKEPEPQPWPRSDWDEAAELVRRSQEMSAREASTQGAMDELRKRVEDLELRRRQFLETTDGPWTGDLLGFAAQPKQKFIDTYLLKEITPTLGFFTKSVIDLRIKFTPEDERQLSASRAAVVSASNVLDKMKASALVQELEMKQERARKAADYAKKIEQWPELKYRFQRDSLYLYLREKYQNTTDQQLNAWFDQWLKNNGMATANAMIGKELLPASATQPVMAMPLEPGVGAIHDPTQDRTPHPLPETGLRERTKADLERARGLTNAYEDMERRRAAATQRNLDRAKNLFRAENVGLAVEKLKGDAQIRQYLLAMRYLAVPRLVPQLKTAIYRIATAPPNTDPLAEKNTEYIFKYGTSLIVDPTLYFPDPAGAGAAEVAGQYYMKHSYLLPAAAKSAAASGIGDGIPLLPGSGALISQLLIEHSKDVENGQGLIVLSSAFANDMADMTHALPDTFMHLPSVKHAKMTWAPGKDGPLGATSVDGKPRYLMAQSVGFVSTPAPASVQGEEIWFAAEHIPELGGNEYGPLSKFKPIFKVIRQESGAFEGTCDFAIQMQGILRETHAEISGTMDPKTKKVQFHYQGHFLRTWHLQDLEGDNVDFSGTLTGVADSYQLGANTAFVGNSKIEAPGSVTTTFTYLNNKPPSDWPKDMQDRELARTPNIRTTAVQSWYLYPIGRAPAGTKDAKPLKGSWHSSQGQYDLDQCGSCVAGTITFTATNTKGPLIGIGDAGGFSFDCYDGINEAGSAQLSISKDGSYTGRYFPSRGSGTPFSLSR